MSRRAMAVAVAVGVLLALAAAPGAVASASTGSASTGSASTSSASTGSPIRHFVMLMQANHSFDSYFGTYPGADGIPAGTCAPVDVGDPASTCVKPYPLRNDPPEVLDRTAQVQRSQYDNGRMDGFVSAYRALGRDGTTAMGYYDGEDIPFYWNVADEYTLFDRFFSSATVGTRLNAFYWVAGVPTPGGSERVPPEGYGDVPTIFDRLQAAGVSWKFYVENHNPAATFRTRSSATARVPLQNFARFVDDPALAAHIVDLSEYSRDLRAGTLPAVSYIVSNGSSENPPGRIQDGQALARNLVSALETSSAWDSSAFLLTYSGWGGSYDHVPPPVIDRYGPGFRVPALLISPYSRRGAVDHTSLDFTAALKFIETNWGIAPLGARDGASPGLGSAFDFSAPPRPPQLLGLERTPAPLVGAGTRWVVYAGYGGVLLVAAAAAWLPARLRRRSDAPTLEEVR